MKSIAATLPLLLLGGCASTPYVRDGTTPEQAASDERQCRSTVYTFEQSQKNDREAKIQAIVPGGNPELTRIRQATAQGNALDSCMRNKGYHQITPGKSLNPP